MTATQEELFAFLDKLGIAHQTVSHPPIFTAEQGKDFEARIPGMACKNLFLKDKKGILWLIVLPVAKRAQLALIERVIGSARLSFAKPDLLLEVLGITPGSVTPFALMNDKTHRVTVVLDADMMKAEKINVHPLRNDASTALHADDLLKFINALGYSPRIVNCGDWIEE